MELVTLGELMYEVRMNKRQTLVLWSRMETEWREAETFLNVFWQELPSTSSNWKTQIMFLYVLTSSILCYRAGRWVLNDCNCTWVPGARPKKVILFQEPSRMFCTRGIQRYLPYLIQSNLPCLRSLHLNLVYIENILKDFSIL